MSNLQELLGEEYYKELKLANLYSKASTGAYMPPLHTWLKKVNPEYNWDWPYMRMMIDHLQKVSDGEIRKLMIQIPVRHGKGCYAKTPMFTTEGWKTHGELKIGDYVFHPSGKPVQVIGVSEPYPCEYALTFTGGETIICHAPHEWQLRTKLSKRYETRTYEAQELAKKQLTRKDGEWNRKLFFIEHIGQLEFSEQDLLIDPYVFGVWLGDGSSSQPKITHSKDDMEPIEEIVNRGYHVRKTYVHKTTGCLTSLLDRSLYASLKSIGVFGKKHIPDIYKRSSVKQRLELIAGIIDTDGHVEKGTGRVRIVCGDPVLSQDILEVLRTLGQQPYILETQPTLSSSGIQGRKVIYTIGFQPSIDFPTVIPRKKITRINTDRKHRALLSIEKLTETDKMGHCIQVDSPDGMYLVGETLIPTHNSELNSIHFPVYFLEKNPKNRVIIASYNATLAQKMSRRVRSLAKTRIELDPDRKAMEEWDTKEGGGLRAVGVGGGIAGVGANCFVGTTKILTEIGNKTIKDLRVGDTVLSYNLKEKRIELKTVLATSQRTSSALCEIKTRKGKTIRCTQDHLFYCSNLDCYIEARKLIADDEFIYFEDILEQDNISSIRIIDVPNTVYDIQVEGNNNFFAENILVHNCIIIDDPFRSRKDANSLSVRDAVYHWYTDDIFTRQEPDSRIILVMSPWHEDDLGHRILENESDWTLLRLPALAEENDPLGREVGEALNPDRYDREALLNIKAVMGRGFYALYQCRPQEQEGERFKASWFKKVDRLPQDEDNPIRYDFVRYWDKAATTDGDYTVGVLMAKDRKNNLYYIVDVVRGQWLPHTRDTMMLRTAQKDQELYGHVKIYHEEEPGSSGKDAARQTNSLLAGYSVKAIRATGSKELRSEPYQSQVEAGNVYIIKAKWNSEFIDEHASFPNGSNDDIVDAASGAFNQQSKGRGFISIGDRFR